jgi:tRNA pseudouridine38-40 synthase
MRYLLELSYRGTCYNGWQCQPNAPTVQQRIEESLSILLGCETDVVGAGRTDTGVHAAYYVAHFDFDGRLDENFTYRLNSILPPDIAVMGAKQVRDDFHARFDAMRREYRYYIRSAKNPFSRDTEWQYYVDLDIDRMNEAANLLFEQEDFTTFSKLHSGNRTNICSIADSRWSREGELTVYTIAADRFLRNMVRSLVATQVDVGRGKMSVEMFGEVLRGCDRSKATGSAPAQGLFLTDIKYENL